MISDGFDWSLAYPSDVEITIMDPDGVAEAIDAFKPDVEILGYSIGNPRVSVKDEKKIVRLDIIDSAGNVVGIAIRLKTRDATEDAIRI